MGDGLEASPRASRTAEAIRDVVSARYVGLSRAAVPVIDLNTGNIVSSSSPNSGGFIPDDPYAIRKRYYEREWRSKIQDMLSMIPGVKVQVNVVLEAARHGPNHGETGSETSKLVPIEGIASIAIPHAYYRMIHHKRQQDGADGIGVVEWVEVEPALLLCGVVPQSGG